MLEKGRNFEEKFITITSHFTRRTDLDRTCSIENGLTGDGARRRVSIWSPNPFLLPSVTKEAMRILFRRKRSGLTVGVWRVYGSALRLRPDQSFDSCDTT